VAALTKVEELRLIARCVAFDDHRAYGRLVEAWQPALLRYLHGITGGDIWLSDDIAQETFVKAYENLSTFRGAARFSTWLFTIATRLFLDSRRKNNNDMSLTEAAGIEAPDNGGFDARHDVAVALASLEPLDRSIVLLFYLRDLPVKQVAKIVDMTPGAVKVRLHRAKQKMRLTLENH